MTERPGAQRATEAPALVVDEATRLNELARQREAAGDNEGAIAAYSQLLDRYPADPDAHNNLAVLLKSANRLPAAIALLQRALNYAPNSAVLYSNLGNMLWLMLAFDESMAAFRRAIELDSARPETFHNLGLLHFSRGDYPAALQCYDRSLALKPGNRLVLWDRTLALLASGDYARGFAEYDVRLDFEERSMGFDVKLRTVRSIPLPLWQGEEIAGRTLYVYAEQGLGDTVQFARFLTLAAQRGARVIFDCQPELLRLLANLPGLAELRPQPSPLPAADFHLPLMSLPARLGVTLDNLPADIPYIVPPPAIVGPGVPRADGTRFAIGIVWAGRPEHANDHNRSMQLEYFLTLANLPGVALYSLQKGSRADDITKLSAHGLVHDLAPQIHDFADTARLILQLDWIITIDSAVAHLAGALGRPGFVLLPFTPDWRWLNGREKSPWYPSLRPIRQPAPRDWAGVMRQVRAALTASLGARS
jgi:tetratricopeptide (TPR) repeat protein